MAAIIEEIEKNLLHLLRLNRNAGQILFHVQLKGNTFTAEIIPFIKEQTIQINELKFTLTGFSSIEMIDSNVSPRYGILISAKKIVARLNGLKSIQKISIPKNQNNNRLS